MKKILILLLFISSFGFSQTWLSTGGKSGGGGGGALTVTSLTTTTLTATNIIGGVVVTKPTGVSTVYKPAANTDIARGNALTLSYSNSSSGDYIWVTPGDYKIESTLNPNARTWYSTGARIYHTSNTINTFQCDSSTGDKFSLLGKWVLEGSGNKSGATEIGLKIKNVANVILENIEFKKFGYECIELNQSGYYKGDRMNVQMHAVTCDSSNIGIRVNSTSEFDQLNEMSFVVCDTGFVCQGAAGSMTNFNILDCIDGMHLNNGANDTHWQFGTGVIAHCTGKSIWANNNAGSAYFSNVSVASADSINGAIVISGGGSLRMTGGGFNAAIKTTGQLTTGSVFQGGRNKTTCCGFAAHIPSYNVPFIKIIDVVDEFGYFSFWNTNSTPAVASGTYTPTWTGLANTTTVTIVAPIQYQRVDNTVYLYGGQINITTTVANTLTYLSLSLPTGLQSTWSGTGYECGGSITSNGNVTGKVEAYTSGLIRLLFNGQPSTSAVAYQINCSYRLD